MGLRSYSVAEVRKSCSMSKGPDLSAFPIPRKGGAKPIDIDEAARAVAAEEQRGGEGGDVPRPPRPSLPASSSAQQAVIPETSRLLTRRTSSTEGAQPSPPAPSGQTVATTVKLDENRYLRLADAGRPGPGRLKRRTIQEMVIEALDEWFERRGI